MVLVVITKVLIKTFLLTLWDLNFVNWKSTQSWWLLYISKSLKNVTELIEMKKDTNFVADKCAIVAHFCCSLWIFPLTPLLRSSKECVEVDICHRISQCVSHLFSTVTTEPSGRLLDPGTSQKCLGHMFKSLIVYRKLKAVTQQRRHLCWQPKGRISPHQDWE